MDLLFKTTVLITYANHYIDVMTLNLAYSGHAAEKNPVTRDIFLSPCGSENSESQRPIGTAQSLAIVDFESQSSLDRVPSLGRCVNRLKIYDNSDSSFTTQSLRGGNA